VIVADVVEAEGTEAPVVLGAADERAIPELNGHAPQPAQDDADEEDVEAPAPAQLETAEDDESRYSPRPPRRRRLRRPLLLVLALVLLAGVALGSAYGWARTQFYVGVAGENVAIYRGLAERLPAIPLSRVYQVEPLAVAALPPYYQDKVRGNIEVASLQSARDTVAELRAAAERCASPSPSPSGTVRPTSSPGTPSATPKPTPSKSPSPTGKPTSTRSDGPVAPEC
jgi:PPM family protein phosphatase